MTNDVATLQPNPFEVYATAATSNRPAFPIAKFNKGDYTSGKYGDEIPVGTEMVAAMDYLEVGFIDWDNNLPVERIMGRVVDGYVRPKRSDLGKTDKSTWETDDRGDPKDPFQLTNEIVLITRKSSKDIYLFATSSKGGIGAIGELCKVYGRHMREKPNEWPIIKLDVGSYQHTNKAYGRIKFPTFPVVGWVDKESFLKATEADGTSGAAEPAVSEAIENEKQERAAKAARRGASLAETY